MSEWTHVKSKRNKTIKPLPGASASSKERVHDLLSSSTFDSHVDLLLELKRVKVALEMSQYFTIVCSKMR